jgi:hypothetical protein
MEGGHVHGHDGVRAYWRHQWSLIDPFVEPQAFMTEPDGRIVVEVRQRVLGKDGNALSEGTDMEIRKPVEDANPQSHSD